MSTDSPQFIQSLAKQSLAATGVAEARSATPVMAPTLAAVVRTGAGVASRSETSCCTPGEQLACCAPAEKSRCCGPESTAGGGCGCR